MSLDGGGFLGLSTAVFIDGIEKHFRTRFHDRFELFCGTSTGAIIALGIAFGLSGADIVKLYEDLGSTVFVRTGRGCIAAKYDNKPLRSELDKIFGNATIGDLQSKRKRVLVTAFNVTTGTPRLFKTNHSSNLTRDHELKITDVAMASSAAPTYFPVVRITNPYDNLTEDFCDGGVVANHPALLGFTEGVSELGAEPGQIRLLSLSTPRTDIGEGPHSQRSLNRGLCRWGSRLASMFIDSNARTAHEVMRRLVASYPSDMRPLYERIEMHNKEGFEMDDVSERCKTTLKHWGTTMAASNEIRPRVNSILGVSHG